MTILLILVLILVAILLGFHIQTRRIAKQSATLVPPAGEIHPVPGGSIHYVEAGQPERQTLVLIHGLSGQLQHFTYALMDDLAQDFHVIALDRPGCGYSRRDRPELATLPEQARMIRAFLDGKGVTAPVLVGHSLGGAVSLAMALDAPDHTAGLALICPLTHRMQNSPAMFKPLEIRTNWLRVLLGQTIAVPMARKTAPQVLEAVFAPEPAPDDFLIRAGGALGLRPGAFVTAAQDLVGADISIGQQAARYSDLTVPGGILYAAQDAVISGETQGRPMEQYGLSYQEIDGRGHMIPITAPDACAAFIRKVDSSLTASDRAAR